MALDSKKYYKNRFFLLAYILQIVILREFSVFSVGGGKVRRKPKEVEMAKKKAAKKPPTKSEVLNALAEKTGLKRKQVSEVFDELNGVIKKSLKGAGCFTMPGLVKIRVVRKPATKARKGINPFTKEPTVFKAKPARNVVKATALKGLKEMV
jgi:nucleoid DNA-binding protein